MSNLIIILFYGIIISYTLSGGVCMIIKRILGDCRGKSVEVAKPTSEVVEMIVTAVMVSKAVGTVQKEDVMCLAYVYQDADADSEDVDLSAMYGESGIIAGFVSDGINAIGDNPAGTGKINSIELLISRKGFVVEVKINFDNGTSVKFDKLSRPFCRILGRLK